MVRDEIKRKKNPQHTKNAQNTIQKPKVLKHSPIILDIKEHITILDLG